MSDFDPFASIGDTVQIEGGNSRPRVLGPSSPSKGFQRHRGTSTADNVWCLVAQGDPERGGTTDRKRAKPVNHNARSRKEIEALGYTVNKLEKMVVGRGGFAFNVDYLGLWDYEGLKNGKPRLLVQVCGEPSRANHLRKMCSDRRAPDNRKPLVDNLRYCLDQGWHCVLLSWEKQPNGRYESTATRITHKLVDEVIARRRK